MATARARTAWGRPRRRPGERYSTTTYGKAITRGCDAAFPPPAPLGQLDDESPAQWKARLTKEQRQQQDWRTAHRFHAHQARHTVATSLRKDFGLEAAQVVLGHRTLNVTQIYAAKNIEAAKQIAARVG